MTGTIQTISVKQAAELDGAAIDLIDVRTPGEYNGVHATPARLAPLDRLDPKAIAASRKGAADTPIYLICRTDRRSRAAAEQFVAAGITNVVVVEGGTNAWVAAGLPVVRGRGVIGLDRQVRIVAGLLVLTGVGLAIFVHPWFIGLSAFIGAGLAFAGITDKCPMTGMLARMPWNQGGQPG
jgi:rhodanese-related sulfurtransferase